MAHILIMPRQGNTVESCVISEWRVKEGDPVQADTTVCVVETDKAAFEIPAGAAGTVLKILYPAGADVPVLRPIMAVGNPGENRSAVFEDTACGAVPAGAAALPTAAMPTVTLPAAAMPAAPPQTAPVAAVPSTAAVPAAERLPVSPRARALAEKEALGASDLASLTGSGPGGRIIERDLRAVLESRAPLTAAAKAELREQIGIGGRITLARLRAGRNRFSDTPPGGFAGEGPPSEPPAGRAGGPVVPDGKDPEYIETPVKGIRRVIADRMMLSHTSTAAFTLNASAPALSLQKLRACFKASDPGLGMSRITINDMILFAVSRVLLLYPAMNAHKIIEDPGSVLLRTYNTVHLGFAAATSRGLMVPVLRNAERRSLPEISRGAKALAESCRNGTVSPDELHGSTFTVTNLGNAGVESFTPVINVPETAVLGVCAITPRPAEISPGRYEILPHVGLSLTVDHTVVDEAPGADFLKALCGVIKDIDLWLIK